MRRTQSVPRRTIEIRIDRLVLDGLSASGPEREQIGAAVERELARLVGEHGISGAVQSGGATPRADAPAFSSRPEPPQRTGEKIARSVYASFGSRR